MIKQRGREYLIHLKYAIASLTVIILLLSFFSGCTTSDDRETFLDENEALLVALNDSLLEEELNGDEPGIIETEIITGEDGNTIYKFVFYPDPDPGRSGRSITVAVGGNGTVIWHDVFSGLVKTPPHPEDYASPLPEDVIEKGAFAGKIYPDTSIRNGDLNIKLEYAEFTNESSLYCFIAHSMFIKNMSESGNGEPPYPDVLLDGDIFVSGRDPENVTSTDWKRWDGDAMGFSVKSDPVPAGVENITITIRSFSIKERQSPSSYERDGNWSYEVL
ncbi:hypothetical protein Mpet_1564 [Methanolacinia petrolearia DSM 11571]|uniref:Uncharacterized protein n=1 Tax=Methanolacinia petrolearia (strain DSM 11571 / OCM 486 / SEBR 4847) TaxID=679926 RepID=E1RGM6_METP4|nr:hypothetical protein Mpet_1564 [Methanolacinia petrolearia DSM 11571]